MVDVINKQTTQYVSLMELIGELVVQCMSHNIYFRAKHIPSKTNVIADYISRLQEDKAKVMQPTLIPTRCHFPFVGYLGESFSNNH